jgi:hypothetical protein
MKRETEISMRAKLCEIFRSFGVTSLYAFGSRSHEALQRALGLETPRGPATTDLDLAVQPAPGAALTSADRVRLMALFEDLFDSPRVDLVILPEADSFLAAEAVRGELLYCADEDRQAEEELFYLARAGDLAFLENVRLEGILDGELRR